MIFSLDVRRARKGDCLILHYGTPARPGLALIDGGPAQVYGPQLKPRLVQIRKARGLAGDAALPVDLLMISHIDDDHINGILELTGELVEALDTHRPLPLKIRGLWHNSFDDILGNSPAELRGAVTAQFGAAALGGAPDTEGLDPAAAGVLASVDQGYRLRDDARRLKLPINAKFGGGLVMAAQGKSMDMDMGKGLKMTVAGPMQPELAALQAEHDAWLKKRAAEKKTKRALASFTDTSVPNLSSIVVLAECGGKRMLLTGDARGDKILQGLEAVRLLAPGGTLHVDILKAPHHGSDRNIDAVFLRRITADHYVFSGNGEHGNPERETLRMLLDTAGSRKFTLHLTYPVDEIDAAREADWNKQRAAEKARSRKNSKLKVRPAWSRAKHSLAAFLSAHPALAQALRSVEKDRPHVIDLLAPLKF